MSTIEEHNALTVTEIRARIEKPDEYIFPENAAADAATLLALLEYTESKAHYAQLFARVELERTKATLAVEVRHATKLEEHIAPVLEDLIAFCDGGACVGLLADARHALALLTRVSELPPPELLEEPEQDKPATNMLAALPFHGYLGQRYTGTPEQEDERAEALRLFDALHPVVDFWKIGKINHNKEAEAAVDWRAFLAEATRELDRLGAQYYVKKDLLRYKEGT